MAEYNALAYCPDKPSAEAMSHSTLLSGVFAIDYHVNHRNFVYLIGHNPIQETVFVTFRGTIGAWSNLEADIKQKRIKPKLSSDISSEHFAVTNCKGCGIHSGFHDVIQELRSDSGLFNKIMEVAKRYPKYSLVISGNSMGGSLAFLAAFYLTLEAPEVKISQVYMVCCCYCCFCLCALRCGVDPDQVYMNAIIYCSLRGPRQIRIE